MKSSRSRKSLKKRLDDVFSLHVRKIGAFEVNGELYNNCYTCGKPLLVIGGLQCGHYESRRYLATRWEEKNCRPQCVHCNIFSEGKKPEFSRKLMDEDPGILQWLNIKKNNKVKMTDFELEQLIKIYS